MMQKTSRPFLALLFSLLFLLPAGGGASEGEMPAAAITVLGFGSPYSQDFTRQTGQPSRGGVAVVGEAQFLVGSDDQTLPFQSCQ